MRRKAGAALAVASALAACGGAKPADPVAWEGTPLLFAPPTLPADRILTGKVRNASGRALTLRNTDFRLEDAGGRPVAAHVVLLAQFTHRLPPYNRLDPVNPRIEALTGVTAPLRPGDAAPITISWHQPPGSAVPARVRYTSARLALPARPSTPN